MLGLPQLVVPSMLQFPAPTYSSKAINLFLTVWTVGQNPYDSPITDTVEYAPIVASLAGPKGMVSIVTV